MQNNFNQNCTGCFVLILISWGFFSRKKFRENTLPIEPLCSMLTTSPPASPIQSTNSISFSLSTPVKYNFFPVKNLKTVDSSSSPSKYTWENKDKLFNHGNIRSM